MEPLLSLSEKSSAPVTEIRGKRRNHRFDVFSAIYPYMPPIAIAGTRLFGSAEER
jgi:hypothetical protein